MASSSLIDVRRVAEVVVLRRVDVRCGSEGEGPDSAGLVGVDMLLAVLDWVSTGLCPQENCREGEVDGALFDRGSIDRVQEKEREGQRRGHSLFR